MAKKKRDEAQKAVEDMLEDLNAISEESDEGYFNATTYLPLFNEERKAYDMLLVRVDTIRKKAFVEVEKMRYDSEARAMHDVLKRMSEDFMKASKRKVK